jgi:hypothetical protein
MAERRHEKRVTCQADAHIDGLEAGRLHAQVTDLGVGGAHMDSHATLPVGRRAVLSFTLVDREVSAEIEVIYAMPGRGMGVQFINLSSAERELIKSLVDADRQVRH